jgi:hypothetical protein
MPKNRVRGAVGACPSNSGVGSSAAVFIRGIGQKGGQVLIAHWTPRGAANTPDPGLDRA